YGFDTGFVCYHRGWHTLRREDLGFLWEHLVLNENHAHLGPGSIHYWRSKHGNEVDFVLARRGAPPLAIECKWTVNQLDPANLRPVPAAPPGPPSLCFPRASSGPSWTPAATPACAVPPPPQLTDKTPGPIKNRR